MHWFTEKLFSLDFLIFGVLFAIGINILSHFVLKWCGGFFERFSTAWANRNEKLKAEREKRITILQHNPTEFEFFFQRAQHMKLNVIFRFLCIISATLIMFMGLYMLNVLLIGMKTNPDDIIYWTLCGSGLVLDVFFINTIRMQFRAADLTSEVYEARRRRNADVMAKRNIATK